MLETLASLRILFIIKLLIQKGRVATQGEGEGSLRTPFSCAATTLSPKERVAAQDKGELLRKGRVAAPLSFIAKDPSPKERVATQGRGLL